MGVMVVAVFAPGWLLLRFAGIRGLLPLAGAPALSMAFYGVTGIGFDQLGIMWGWGPLIVALILACGLALAFFFWLRFNQRRKAEQSKPSRPAGLWSEKYQKLTTLNLGFIGIALVGSALLMAFPIYRGMVTPDALLQQWDGVFHANGVQAIRETGNASIFGSMQPMFGAVADSYYYPTVWHALIAISPGFSTIAAAANASTFVFGIVVWLLGLAGFGHALFVGRRHHVTLTVLTVIFGASFSAFPFVNFSTIAQWPFGAGIALIPGATALVVAAFRGVPGGVRFATRGRLSVTVIVVATAIAGPALTHGSALFSMALVLLPFILAAAGRAAARRWSRGARGRVMATGVAVVAVFALAIRLLLTNPIVIGLLGYERESKKSYLDTTVATIVDAPLTTLPIGTWPVTICVLVGIAGLVVRAVRGRVEPLLWLIPSWLLIVAFTSLAAGPDVKLRVLTGFWYAQAARIVAVYPVIAAPLAALGLVFIGRLVIFIVSLLSAKPMFALGRSPVLVGCFAAVWVLTGVVATNGWNAALKQHRFEQAYVSGQMKWGTMVREAEMEMLQRLQQKTPQDALILGDPANGAAFAWSVAGRHVVLPHLGASGMSADQKFLRETFNELGQNAEVCDAVRRLGVTHFYQDTAGPRGKGRFDEFSDGLQQPMQDGLRLIDRGGTARLYEIVACD